MIDRWSEKIIEMKMKCERERSKGKMKENKRFKKNQKEDTKKSRNTN